MGRPSSCLESAKTVNCRASRKHLGLGPTWKLLEMKLEKGNWSISGGRVRLGRTGTSGGMDSVMLPARASWGPGKEHRRSPKVPKCSPYTGTHPAFLSATSPHLKEAGRGLRKRQTLAQSRDWGPQETHLLLSSAWRPAQLGSPSAPAPGGEDRDNRDQGRPQRDLVSPYPQDDRHPLQRPRTLVLGTQIEPQEPKGN